MRKTLLYSFLPILMAMLTCTTFIACGDDDEEDYDPKKDCEQFEANKNSYIDKDNGENDSSDDSDDDEGRNCPSCSNGICSYCNGRGYRTVGKNQIECSGCHGTGDCRRCNGTGEIR